MNKIFTSLAIIMIAAVSTSCARSYLSTTDTAKMPTKDLTAREAAEELVSKKALDYCAKYGHKSYERVSSNSTYAMASSPSVSCRMVEVTCPKPINSASTGAQKRCLEHRCFKDSNEWTARLSFRCK